MSHSAIRVERLGKRYHIGSGAPFRTFREMLTDGAGAPFRWLAGAVRAGRGDGPHPGELPSVWALRDVTFEVPDGQVFGIIGRNGAGKSTLLKILSRIAHPTEGRAEIVGRVGSLLEVGTGFHSELTGRENIYLNGAILGMHKVEIDRKFDEIVAFAETERFLDTPVKYYSSGMYMRLAFAVAAHLETQILLVDEVLAVGDAAFQRKCLGKMGDVAQAGRTVLFVSHNLLAVERLCQRALWMRDGRVARTGPTHEVVSQYLRQFTSGATERHWPDRTTAPGNERIRLHRAALRAADGTPTDVLTVRTSLALEIEYWNLQAGARLCPSIHLYNEQGTLVLNTAPVKEPRWYDRPMPVGLYRSECHIPGDLLNDGTYRIELLMTREQGLLHHEPDFLVFELRDAAELRSHWHGRWPGVVRPLLEWRTELLEPSLQEADPVQSAG